MIKISKGIPIPNKVRSEYPYRQMEIGDSFYVEGIALPVICNSNWRYGKKLGMKFIAAKEKSGVRVWRTV